MCAIKISTCVTWLFGTEVSGLGIRRSPFTFYKRSNPSSRVSVKGIKLPYNGVL